MERETTGEVVGMRANPRGAEVDPPRIAAGPTLEELYEAHARQLLDYVHRRTGDVHVAEDLVADVFVDVARALPRYVDRGLPVGHWLLRIAGNAVNRWAGRGRRWVPLRDDPERPPPRREEDDPLLRRALLALPPRLQEVLSLHHLEGHSCRETARILGCREGTVRSRLTRARRRLKRELERTGWSPGHRESLR